MTMSDVVISELSDEGLANFQAYWQSHIDGTRGSFVSPTLHMAAMQQLDAIEAEIKERAELAAAKQAKT